MSNQIDELKNDPRGQKVLRLHDDGESVSAIAREMGIHRHVITGFLAENGIHGKSRRGVRDKVLEHLRSSPGETKTEVAERFGLHPNTVTEYLRGTPEEELLVQARDGSGTRAYSDADIRRSLFEAWNTLDEDGQRRGMSREYYDKRMKELTAIDGRPRPSSALLTTRRFPSWKEACDSVGIKHGRPPVKPVPVQYTRELALKSVVMYINETGDTTYAGYSRWASTRPGAPSGPTVRNRYGKWSEVRIAALPFTAPVA